MPVLTHNIFLAALFGGIITGAGLGLVFRGNASTGGTAIISQIVNKYFKVSLGIAILFVDGLVILSAMYAFNADIVLFSLICLFTIDLGANRRRLSKRERHAFNDRHS